MVIRLAIDRFEGRNKEIAVLVAADGRVSNSRAPYSPPGRAAARSSS